MKLGKASWMFLGIGVLIIVALSMGMTYKNQREEQANLGEQIAVLKTKNGSFSSRSLESKKSDLDNQLVVTKSSFKNTISGLTQTLDSTGFLDSIFSIAGNAGVVIVNSSSMEITLKDVQTVPCQVLSLTVEVEGSVEGIKNFVKLVSDQFPTGEVNSVEINIPKTLDADGVPEIPTGTISLSVYSYREG